MIKMVGMDYDGTLVRHHKGVATIAPEVLQTLQAATRDGLLTGIVTGNPWWGIRDSLAERGGVKWDDPFPVFVVSRENFIHWKQDGQMVADDEWNASVAEGHGELMSWLTNFSFEVYPELEATFEITSYRLMGDYGMLVGMKSEEGAEAVRKWLEQWVEDKPFARVHRNRTNTNIVLARHSLGAAGKGAALQRMSQARGIAPDEVLAVGDGLNDIDMMSAELGFHCATVCDAIPVVIDAVRARGGHVSDKPSTYGLGEILDVYLARTNASGTRGSQDVRA